MARVRVSARPGAWSQKPVAGSLRFLPLLLRLHQHAQTLEAGAKIDIAVAKMALTPRSFTLIRAGTLQTAQGAFADPRARPLRLRPGVAHDLEGVRQVFRPLPHHS